METDRKTQTAQTDDRKPTNPPPDADTQENSSERSKEVGGRDGPDPTRFGDWEKNGRCIDF